MIYFKNETDARAWVANFTNQDDTVESCVDCGDPLDPEEGEEERCTRCQRRENVRQMGREGPYDTLAESYL